MCAALRDIMKEDFEEAEARGVAIGEARGEARGVAIGEARGVAIGEANGKVKGETRLADLIAQLFSLNRVDDVKRCSTDTEYREKLYWEFQIA